MRKFLGSGRGLVLCAAAALAMVPSIASAQFTAEEMDAIVLPITSASIVTQVVTAAAAVLVLVIGWKIAFKLVRSLAARLGRAAS